MILLVIAVHWHWTLFFDDAEKCAAAAKLIRDTTSIVAAVCIKQ
jgi:hypothetical protein